MTKTALITGITGQDGSYLAELLLDKGYEIFGVIRRLSTPNTTRLENIADRITLLEGDLTDQSSLNYRNDEISFGRLVHLLIKLADFMR